MSPQDNQAVPLIPSVLNPAEDDTLQNQQKGSMKDIKKHKPGVLFRSMSEQLPNQSSFFSHEATPSDTKLKRFPKVEKYEKQKIEHDQKQALEIEQNKKAQTKAIFQNKYLYYGSQIIRQTGAVILSVNLILDTSYAFLSTFSSLGILSFYSIMLVVRYAIPILGVVRNCIYKINEPISTEEREQLSARGSQSSIKQAKEEADYFKQGYFLYGALPFCYLVGTHRLLNFKNGSSEMGTGLLIDFFLNAIAFLVIQTLNHGFLSNDATEDSQVYQYSDLQSAVIVFKFFLIIDLLVEIILYSIEMFYFNQFRTRRIMSKLSYSLPEKAKRQQFGARYAMINAIWTGVCMLLILIISAASDQQVCRPDQTISSVNDLICIDCAINNCASCTVSGSELCDTCQAGFYLLQTKEKTECVDSSCRIDQCTLCESQGPFECDQCSNGFFLSEVGHCQSEVCTDAYCSSCETYGPNICDKCLKDYKFNKASGLCEFAPCHLVNCQSCVAESAQCDRCLTDYKLDQRQGKCIIDNNCEVDGCQTCRDPLVCDICDRGLWLDRSKNTCFDGTCQVNNCKVCQQQGPAVCDSCESGFFLSDGLCKSTTCQPGFEFNFNTNECEDKICKVDLCAVCEASGIEVCDRCKDDFWLTEQNTCVDASCTDPACGLCNTAGPSVCNVCKSDYVWVDSQTCRSKICSEGFKWNDQLQNCEDTTCKLPNCLDCQISGINSCDACESGYFFDSAKNSCEPDSCQVQNCAVCESGRNFCDTCETGYYLKDNACIDTSCDDPKCKICASVGANVCDLCAENYFLNQNQCLNTVCIQPFFDFSFETFQCQDTICAVDNCARCETSGPLKCDNCSKGFIYNSVSNSCEIDTSCAVTHCTDCSEDREVCKTCNSGYNLQSGTCIDPNCSVNLCSKCNIAQTNVCDECATGFWLDSLTNSCVSSQCQVNGCEDCSQGPAVCKKCQQGLFLLNNECYDTACPTGFSFDVRSGTCVDIICKVENCKSCSLSGIDLCDQCEANFIASDDKTTCGVDTSCKVLFCDQCETDREVCDTCMELFWLDKNANKCIGSHCRVNDCAWCSHNGPTQCDECELGYLLHQNQCISTSCPAGFEFNPVAVKCEDTVCKIEGCTNCSLSGIWSCDKCQTDYIYESWSKRCIFDSTCRVKGCADCNSDQLKCDACAPGLWYDAVNNICIDGTCHVANCDDCSVDGPAICTKCEKGFHQKSTTECVKCDTDGCLNCSSPSTCTTCEDGRTLTNGVCKGCSKNLCIECDALGNCPQCKPGYFLESDGQTCSGCTDGCSECTEAGDCLQCQVIKHIRIQPSGGRCFCDTSQGWQAKQDSDYDCICTNEWLTVSGECTNCQTAFPGCAECSKITANDTIVDGGVQVVYNPLQPQTQQGTYICKQCSVENTFFNYDAGFCMRCDRDVSGCKVCGFNGKCGQCLPGYALQETGGCYPCDWHSTGCIQCTVDQCLECDENYLKAAGFCFPIPF